MNIIHFIQKPYIYLLSTLCLIIFSCSPRVLPPVETNTTVRDSVVLVYLDCVRVIPIERVIDVVAEYDTLFLSTSLATAKAYVDTNTHTLKGEIKNTNEVQYRYIYKDRIKVKDSLVYVDNPYPVEVEKPVRYVPLIYKILSIIGALALLSVIFYIFVKYLKF